MTEVRVEQNPDTFRTKSVDVSARIDLGVDADKVRRQIDKAIVQRIVDEFMEAHGDEVMASIDMVKLKKSFNEKIIVAALKQMMGAYDMKELYDR